MDKQPWYIGTDGKRNDISATSFGAKHAGGSFQGRTGSVTRSRKGRTTRKPNGTRRYFSNDVEVVAYYAGSYVNSASETTIKVTGRQIG